MPSTTPRRTLQTLLIAALLLTGCAAQFDCSPQDRPLPQANAGCFVAHGEALLLVQQHNGLWGPPGGGATRGESAQCTAQRETWEEAGVRVEVGELLRVFDNGFHLFRCHSDDPPPAPQPRSAREIKAAQWLPAGDLQQLDWRFPSQQSYLRQLLLQAH